MSVLDNYSLPLRETALMGLFSRKKEPAAPRIAITDRVPSTPKNDALTNYLQSSGGSYDALGGDGLADSAMNDYEREVWLAMRKGAEATFTKLKVPHYNDPDNSMRGVLGYLVRDPRDPRAIWLEVNGVRVDRLVQSSVAAWEGGPAEPYPVRCSLMVIGSKPQYNRPVVQIHRNKTVSFL